MDPNMTMRASGIRFIGIVEQALLKDPSPVSRSENTVTYAYKGDDLSEAVLTFATDGTGRILGTDSETLSLAK